MDDAPPCRPRRAPSPALIATVSSGPEPARTSSTSMPFPACRAARTLTASHTPFSRTIRPTRANRNLPSANDCSPQEYCVVVIAEWQRFDEPPEALAAQHGRRLTRTGVEALHSLKGSALVVPIRRGPALVQVLRRVHDNRELGGQAGQQLAGGPAEGLLEEVDQVDLEVDRQPRHRTDVDVGVAVHVAGGPHVDLDDRKALRRQSAFTSGFGPAPGDHVDDVDPGREKRPVPGPVRRIAPGMENAQHAHTALSCTSQ